MRALAAKKISAELCVVLQDAVKIINYIENRAFNSHIFSNLCKEMDSEFSSLFLHTEVRWLSRGKALKRLIVLKDELMRFLSESNSDLVKYFQDKNWLCKLCYFSDIYKKLNNLNLSLQGENSNFFTLISKVEVFIKKVSIWLQKIANSLYEMFTCMEDFIQENELGFDAIKPLVINYLTSLKTHFEKYFMPELDAGQFHWVQNPFDVGIQKVSHLALKAQEEFSELFSDFILKVNFSKKSLSSFWVSVKTEYLLLSELAILTLLPFASTYLCEKSFLTLTYVKIKYRSNLKDLKPALRPAITEIEPRFDVLCQNMQAHWSH